MRPLSDHRLSFACFLACLGLNLACSLVGWDHSIREIHESRQVQTALSARYLQREGLSVDYPLPLFGPPWSAPFEFPLYQGAVAVLADLTGLPLEPAGRLAALLFFYLALPAVFLLQEFLPIPRERRWLLPGVLLLSPVYAYYSRTFMIESAALCASVWFLLAFGRALTRGGPLWLAAAVLLAVLAAAVKLTTFVVFLFPAGLLAVGCLLRPAPGPQRVRLALIAAGIAGAGLAAGLLWTRHADAVKASNPLAAVFVSAELRPFVLGSPLDRISGAFWSRVAGHAEAAVIPATNALLLLLFGLVLCRQVRLPVLALLGAFATGPLVFSNLYAVHDYYLYASGLFALAALVVAWSALLDLENFSRPARWGVVALSLGLQFATYAARYLPAQRAARAPVELAQVLAAVTAPTDVFLALGHDWNPILAYEADRRAVMVVDRMFHDPGALEEVIRRVEPGRITALVVAGHLRNHPESLRPLLRRLDLHPEPVFLGPEVTVYLEREAADLAAARVAGLALRSLSLVAAQAEGTSQPRQRLEVARLPDPRVVAMLHPRPVEIAHPFGLAVHQVDGRAVTDAHAPTDITFAPVPGSTRVEIEFGILPGAATADFPTDGVLFRVEVTRPGARNRILFSRELTPVRVSADRGIQSATFPLPPDDTGNLVFRTLPGPSGSIVSDWAYWARIDIR